MGEREEKPSSSVSQATPTGVRERYDVTSISGVWASLTVGDDTPRLGETTSLVLFVWDFETETLSC